MEFNDVICMAALCLEGNLKLLDSKHRIFLDMSLLLKVSHYPPTQEDSYISSSPLFLRLSFHFPLGAVSPSLTCYSGQAGSFEM